MQADNYFFIKFFIERSITNKKISTLYVTRYHWSIEVVSSREIQVRLVLESLAELALISGTQWVGLFGHYLCRPEQSAVPPGAERRNSPAQKCKKEFLGKMCRPKITLELEISINHQLNSRFSDHLYKAATQEPVDWGVVYHNCSPPSSLPETLISNSAAHHIYTWPEIYQRS